MKPKLTWVKAQTGLYEAYDDAKHKIGYVLNRGGGAWSASGPGHTASAESLGEAKKIVLEAYREWRNSV